MVASILDKRRLPLLLFSLYCLISIFSCIWLWQSSYQKLITANHQQLERFSSHLESQLERFAYIPQLLSRQSLMADALQAPHNSALREIVNRHLAATNQIIGASDTYLLDTKGTTIAASNWLLDTSFVGQDFSFRPYFQQAMAGQQGNYFALGSMSGKRGYYFSYPVKYAAEVIGVVVVKMNLSSIEQDWSGKSQHFVVTDPNDVVFISTQTSWLFKSLTPLQQALKNDIASERRYLSKEIEVLPFVGEFNKSPAMVRVSVEQKNWQTTYLYLKHTPK